MRIQKLGDSMLFGTDGIRGEVVDSPNSDKDAISQLIKNRQVSARLMRLVGEALSRSFTDEESVIIGWDDRPRNLELVSSLTVGKEPALIECMTLWLNNWLHYQKDEEQIMSIIDQLLTLPRDLVFVLNEVGHGIIPENPLARKFVDWSGKIGSRLGKGCDEIWCCIAGHPMQVK